MSVKDILDKVDELSPGESDRLLRLLESKTSRRVITDDDDLDSLQNLFVAAFIATKGSVHAACSETGITHKQYQRWLSDPLFKAKLAFGRETWIEELRRTAHELAVVSKDRDMVKFLLTNYSPEEFDSGLRKQLAQNQGQLDAIGQVTKELTKEEFMKVLADDPMVDYTDPEFWQNLDGSSQVKP